MVDLHNHILPSMDDGPASCEESVELVKMELAGGVDTIAVTPHFAADRESIASFAVRRSASLQKLTQALGQQDLVINIVEGAEVFLSPELPRLRHKRALCYSGTAFMLTELPDYYQPDWMTDVFDDLLLEGITPVLAHVERYPYLMKNPALVEELIAKGLLIQCNADTLLYGHRRLRRHLFRFMRQGMIHLIATDTHSLRYRPPNLPGAMDLITDRYGVEKAAWFDRNGHRLLNNYFPAPLRAGRPGRR